MAMKGILDTLRTILVMASERSPRCSIKMKNRNQVLMETAHVKPLKICNNIYPHPLEWATKGLNIIDENHLLQSTSQPYNSAVVEEIKNLAFSENKEIKVSGQQERYLTRLIDIRWIRVQPLEATTFKRPLSSKLRILSNLHLATNKAFTNLIKSIIDRCPALCDNAASLFTPPEP